MPRSSDPNKLDAEKCIELYFQGGSIAELKSKCTQYAYQAIAFYARHRGIFRQFEGVNNTGLGRQVQELRRELAELRAVIRDLIRVIEPLRRKVMA